jgi:hypothetical protein
VCLNLFCLCLFYLSCHLVFLSSLILLGLVLFSVFSSLLLLPLLACHSSCLVLSLVLSLALSLDLSCLILTAIRSDLTPTLTSTLTLNLNPCPSPDCRINNSDYDLHQIRYLSLSLVCLRVVVLLCSVCVLWLPLCFVLSLSVYLLWLSLFLPLSLSLRLSCDCLMVVFWQSL